MDTIKFPQDRFGNSTIIDLISFVYRIYYQHLSYHIQDLNITPSQIRFILFLRIHDNISQDEIAHYLFLSRGSTAKTLSKLDDQNIIERRVNSSNKRKYDVFLTEKGKDIVSKIESIDKEWEKLLYENFKGENELEIMEFLKKLAISSMEIIQGDIMDMDFSIMENHPVHGFPHFRYHFSFERFR